MNLEELKSNIIQNVKNNYSSNVIYRAYPIYKQINIARTGGDELTQMEDFIDGKKTDIEVIESEINGLEDSAILDNFVISNDADESEYAGAVLTNLTTDEQKLYVACALRFLKNRGY